MIHIDKDKEKIIPQRAPQKREAPVPLRGPTIRRRTPGTPAPSKLNEIFKDSKSLQFDQNTGFHGGPSARRKGYRLALWSWLASFIDALILISASCVFILAFSLIVKTSVGALFGGLAKSQHQAWTFAEVFFVCGWVYMVAIRSFMGSTIGEWACDLRLGQPHERLKSGYLFRVALRSTLILLTGIVTLPILSLILGRDIAGILSGLRLFSLK
ncbi:RDD family protein [Bdellovibrio sp. 22V]|uniref:RDD family protein n=1 Tax=Bdellovibrio sp. 22V TaxID=3044166 RepID=UPI002542D35F|nr:RDD family protein [Bdellovibrio sp. 22V]WII71082.1 RDD family protein [Bdellovibrio sp. 22V]